MCCAVLGSSPPPLRVAWAHASFRYLLDESHSLRRCVRHWTAQGMSLGPALASNYRKQANAIGLYNTRSGKGSGLPTGEAPWARPEAAPGYSKTARTTCATHVR
jgi:hypothetical protein